MPGQARLSLLLPPVVLTLSLLAADRTSADEVTLKNGSRLLGEVVSRDDGTLLFKTEFAGTLKIKWKHILSLQADTPMEFLFDDGRTLKVTRVSNRGDDMTLFLADQEPAETVRQSEVSIINPEPWRKGTGVKFTGHANAALSRQKGNTDRDEVDLDANLTLRRLNDRFRAFGELENDRADNQKIKDAWKLEGNYNYFVSRQWYWGGFARFEHDQFADLNLRSTVGPLVGFQWIESREMNLSTSTGVSYVAEDYRNQPDDNYVAIPWQIDFDRYLFNEFAQLYHKQTGLWSLADAGDVVFDTWTGLRFPLVLGLVASTELKFSYDGSVPDNASKTDTTYSLKLGYAW